MAAWVSRLALLGAVTPSLREAAAAALSDVIALKKQQHDIQHTAVLQVTGGGLVRREVQSPDSALEASDGNQMHKASSFIRYTLHSKGKACGDGNNGSNDTFLWEGTDSQCRKRCSAMEGCMYFTTYRGDYCELSRSCRHLVDPRDASAVTFSSAAACDGELKVPMCEHGNGTVVNMECTNDITKPCLTGNRPCFKLYDTDDTGLAGRNGTQVQVLLTFPTPTRVTRLDSIGTFKNNFTMASRLTSDAVASDWSALPGSFLSNEKGQTVGEIGKGVLGTQFRVTWMNSEDAKGASWPGAKLFLRGCLGP